MELTTNEVIEAIHIRSGRFWANPQTIRDTYNKPYAE